MIHTETKTSNISARRILSGLAAVSFSITSVLGIAASANASEMNPVITFDGNTLANEPIGFEVGQRIEIYQLLLDPLPLTRERTTSRPGYSFGGWSNQPGGPPITTLSSSSYTSTRVFLYAVWNTKINLDGNGATRGAPVALDYRFSQELSLPGQGSLKRKGYSFGGWMETSKPGPIISSYRAGSLDDGNPTLYAAWKKTINFSSKGSTGAVPASVTLFDGEGGIALPATAGTLSRPGFEFQGWRAKKGGKAIKNTTAYLPKKANVTLRAIWKRTR